MISRDDIQQQALKAILESRDEYGRCRCTVEAITGIGKTFISLLTIKELQPKTVLFLAETEVREKGIRDDIDKFLEVFKYDIYKNCKITFMCYQSAYKKVGTYYDMVIADEIHDSLSEQYFKYYENNKYSHLLGLSATIDKRTIFKYLDGTEYTKIELLNKIAPICFTYTIKQGQEDGTSRKLCISVIEQELDSRVKNIPVTYKDKKGIQQTFYQCEKEYYDYCHKRYMQSMYSDSDFLKRYWQNKRNTIIYNLPTKTQAVITLLTACDFQKTIVFGNSILELNKICPTVSSKNRKETNAQLISDFNQGKLNTIGSFKMLKQGINLNDLNNVIFHSYYSVEKDFLQRSGRLRNKNVHGNVIIFVTKGTQEEQWLAKIKESVSLEFQTYKGLTEFIKDYVQ